MPELPNWKKCLVVQRDPLLGCIPAGYEWLLRMAEVQSIDLATFQDDFNLQAQAKGDNNFDTVAEAVEQVYPQVKIRRKSFEREQGQEKVEALKSLIESGTPCLISLTQTPQGGWHIMPVIYCDNLIIRMIQGVEPTGKVYRLEVPIGEIVRIHYEWRGGKDIAWLEAG